MIPLVLETIVERLVPMQKGSFPWVDDQPTKEDLDHIYKQTSDEFDALGLKDAMLADLRSGKATLVTKSGPFAKMLAVVYPDTVIPWDILGDIFVAFGKPKRRQNAWRVVWFAHPSKRLLPTATAKEPGPEHMNGGYTLACTADTIVIYREEEVCRVLVHELLHASCTDNPSLTVVEQEAATETWAELFLIAIRAKGSLRRAATLWSHQAQWIADQEYTLTNHHVKETSYAWRYTIARKHVLRELGISLPPPASTLTSLRFTHAGI
jgi:hypothetical protein